MEGRKIKVLVVDDSAVFQQCIARQLSLDPRIEVIGTAADAYDAMAQIKKNRPDVVTVDVHMPKMNGIDFVKYIMSTDPLPIVVVSSASETILEALGAGAVDFVTKPNEKFKPDMFYRELVIKVKIAITARLAKPHAASSKPAAAKPMAAKPAAAGTPLGRVGSDAGKNILIAIGASTGGTEAIYSVLKPLPADMPGIVIVQHMPPKFTTMYAERMNRLCNMSVKEAENGDRVKKGLVLIAPGDFQLTVKQDAEGYYVCCKKGEKVNGHCPSVDVMFDSVAKLKAENTVGVILTGMGSDGAKGLLNMRKNGSYTIGQNEKSCVVYGMPRVSYNIGAVKEQADLNDIPLKLLTYIRKNR